MKKVIFIFCIIIFISSGLTAQESFNDYKNASISFDPLTFIGLLIAPDESEIDFRNMWFGMDFNWETENQKETGFGIILQANRIAIKTQYRSFYNKERQSGFFWGLYGLIEWRNMRWYYENNNLAIVWTYPSIDKSSYHSIGITGGFDIGFRFRISDIGITPYMGLGIPLFYCFGNLPPENYMQEFYMTNAIIRAVNIGIKLDFFNFRGTL
jgi:hypothetical protein